MLYFCTEIVFWKFDLELILQKNKNSLRLACMKKNLEKFRTKLIEIWSSQNSLEKGEGYRIIKIQMNSPLDGLVEPFFDFIISVSPNEPVRPK